MNPSTLQLLHDPKANVPFHTINPHGEYFLGFPMVQPRRYRDDSGTFTAASAKDLFQPVDGTLRQVKEYDCRSVKIGNAEHVLPPDSYEIPCARIPRPAPSFSNPPWMDVETDSFGAEHSGRPNQYSTVATTQIKHDIVGVDVG